MSWISIKDSLPEYGVKVMVSGIRKNIIPNEKDKSFINIGSILSNERVITWIIGHSFSFDYGEPMYWKPMDSELPEELKHLELSKI